MVSDFGKQQKALHFSDFGHFRMMSTYACLISKHALQVVIKSLASVTTTVFKGPFKRLFKRRNILAISINYLVLLSASKTF